jgi:hypothetical protein
MKRFFFLILLGLIIGLTACATATPVTTELKNPTIVLNKVEVQSYFPAPWAGWPGAVPTPTPPPAGTPAAQYVPFPGTISVPLVLGFVWDINNPNDAPVTLDQMKFTVEFEAAPSKAGEYFALATPIVYEKQTIPSKTTNQVRAVVVLDSAVVPGNLAVTSGQRLGALGLSGATLVRDWWANIGDFKFGIKATGGTADMTVGGAKKVVTFDGKFPIK